MKLLIDSGNSRLKWGWAEHNAIINTGVLFNHHVSFDTLIATWQAFPKPQIIALSCVNSPKTIELIYSVVGFLWPSCTVLVAKSQAIQCGVRNAYQQPEKLGIDRWLALIAVYHDYHQAACVVDCGTAITVDVVDANGNHQGGLISPGLALMQQALVQGTHLLSFNVQNYAFGLANFTQSAIYNGTLFAACGLIERVIAQQSTSMLLILTGGDAKLIATQLRCDAIVDDNVVLRGLIYTSEGVS
jgi:type III pantothenate kinase